jgi:SAM-dependent methyltransferase
MKNNIEKELINLGIIDLNNIIELYPTVRDSSNIRVLKDKLSNVIYLSENSYIDNSKYEDKNFVDYWGGGLRETALINTLKDDNRRFKEFTEIIKNKNYMDFGTGLGGVLDLFKSVAKSVSGIELQKEIRDYLSKSGYVMYGSLEEVPSKVKFDVVSLFHVFEHLSSPLKYLKDIKDKLEEGGKIIIEVPHASDALLSLYDIDEFKKFTFWSEHLILHTRLSLEIYLKSAGFKNIIISGYQRYPLANHIYWLNKKKPGGQILYNFLSNESIDSAYQEVLNKIDKTDTLIAIAEK